MPEGKKPTKFIDLSIDIVTVMLFALASIIFGVGCATSFWQSYYKQSAVNMGCAEYNRTTGEFEWRVK